MANKQKRRSLAQAFRNEPAPTKAREQLAKPATNGDPRMVPGKGGNPVSAESPVNMTFTVTAEERYLWTLELKRRGVSAVSVLRRAMNELLEEDGAS